MTLDRYAAAIEEACSEAVVTAVAFRDPKNAIGVLEFRPFYPANASFFLLPNARLLPTSELRERCVGLAVGMTVPSEVLQLATLFQPHQMRYVYGCL